MAFSLKSLLKRGKKDAQNAWGDEDDSPFAPSQPDEIPAMEAERIERSLQKGKKKSSPAAELLGKLTAILPFGKKTKKDGALGPDPFDNPELMALIASEVAAIPLPENVAEADADPQVVKRKAPPETATAAPAAAVEDTDDDEELQPLEDDIPAFMAKPEREYEGMPDFAMPSAAKYDTRYEGDEDGGTGFSLGGVDDDDRQSHTMKQAQKKKFALIAAGIVGLAVLGGGAMSMMGGSDAPDAATAADGANAKDPAMAGQNAAGKNGAGISGDRISMALPPPPAAAAPEMAEGTTEKSSSRRPWLNESPAAPDAAAATPPTQAQTQAAAQAAPEAAPAAAPQAQAPAPAEAQPPAVAQPPVPAPAPTPAKAADPALSGGATQVALAPLPSFKAPEGPMPPTGPSPAPAYSTLPKPKDAPAPLTPAPIAGLTRQSPLGVLPVRAADGRSPWQAYARPFKAETNTPRIALIVVGLGLDPEATQAAITSLPPDVTLAFSPYAPKLAEQIAAARAAGHEVLLDLPMEPDAFPSQDPGPLAMLTTLSKADNLTRLETALAKGAGYTGVVSRMGSKFTASPQSMRPVLEALSSRGLLYVSSSDAEGLAANVDLPLPMAEAITVVDQQPFRAAIDARLQYVQDAAKARGTAVAIVNAYPLSFHRLVAWAASLEQKGMHLAPVSAAVSGSAG